MDSNTKYNPLYDPKTDNQTIAADVQVMINKPVVDPTGYSPEDQAFLDKIMKLVEEKKINLYAPSSLLNTTVYDALDVAGKAKADQNSMLMITKIREISNLMQISKEPTYQLKNLVASLRQNKEETEKISGDIFII